MTTDLCSDCAVRNYAICSTLSDIDLGPLKAISHHRSVERGSTVIWAGDDSILCGNVLSGVLKMTALSSDGREQIVGLLFAPDLLGRPQRGQMPFSVTAVTDCELCVFPRAPFLSMVEDHIEMERLLLRRTETALDEARSRMLLLARGTAAEKIAGFLLEMANRSTAQASVTAPGQSPTVDITLSRGQIADVLGLTIETVSRQMTYLRTAGIIALAGSRAIIVLDRPALRARSMMN